ncbi:IclR family transcriptional regulator [Janibacter cremeus]|uniref:DNA-binding IclR family transcriptional regulator n=1 Tax=Janibacter cremeus TaxID=1285192 RepID=A0A852VN77_9MICO|nr:IclR family transcriptional regulator [Janibacter cremeus]NYF97576.1 DNA-binding IclR family transcriptional regulator [Janibacter cremeus]
MANATAAGHALRALTHLASRAEPVPAAHLARALGLPRSSTYHLLTVLVEHGYVVHYAEDRAYGLGSAVHELGAGYQRQDPLQRLARPHVERLVDTTTHNAHLAVLTGRDVLYVIEERAAGRPSLVTDVGVRLPATLTASGLAVLAALPRRQVTALYPSAAVMVDGGPETPSALRRELVTTRARGYALEVGSIQPELSSVASAVRDRDRHPVAAVAITFRNEEIDQVAQAELASATQRVAEAIGSRL